MSILWSFLPRVLRSRRCPKCGAKEHSFDNGLCLQCLKDEAHRSNRELHQEIDNAITTWGSKDG